MGYYSRSQMKFWTISRQVVGRWWSEGRKYCRKVAVLCPVLRHPPSLDRSISIHESTCTLNNTRNGLRHIQCAKVGHTGDVGVGVATTVTVVVVISMDTNFDVRCGESHKLEHMHHTTVISLLPSYCSSYPPFRFAPALYEPPSLTPSSCAPWSSYCLLGAS